MKWTHTIHRFVAALMVIGVLGLFSESPAQEPVHFLVAPFKIHADRDLSYLQRGVADMLATRLTSEKTRVTVAPQAVWESVSAQSGLMSETEAAAIGRRYDADFVVYGSLTLFGDNVSTNAQCLDVEKKTLPVVFTRAGSTMGDVIPQIHQFAGTIREKILGEAPVVEAAAPGAAGTDDIRRHPEAVWQETAGGVGFGLPGIIRSQTTDASGQFTVWRSPELSDKFTAMAVDDLDGDGKLELVAASDKSIVAFHYQAGRLIEVNALRTDANVRFVAVDAADMNGNGRAEVFVSAIYEDRQRLCSHVAEWSGSALEWIVTCEPTYYRVLKGADGQAELYGQSWGADAPFSASVFRLVWRGGEYVRTDRETLPKGVNLFSFAKGDVTNDGQEDTIFFTSQETLQVRNADGAIAWTGAESYTGGGNFVEYPSDQFEVNPRYGALARYYIPQRIHIQDSDGDGANEVILTGNVDRTGRVLPRIRLFKEGRVHALSWNELGLGEAWQTQALSGHISDTAVADLDHDGRKELVVMVVPPMALSLSQPKSYVVMWKLANKAP